MFVFLLDYCLNVSRDIGTGKIFNKYGFYLTKWVPNFLHHAVAISPSHTSPATIEEEDEEEAPPPPIATRPEKTKSIYTKPIEEVEPKMTLTPINESTGKKDLNYSRSGNNPFLGSGPKGDEVL